MLRTNPTMAKKIAGTILDLEQVGFTPEMEHEVLDTRSDLGGAESVRVDQQWRIIFDRQGRTLYTF